MASGVESIRFLQSYSAPLLLVLSLALLAYMYKHKAGGFGPMLAAPSKFATTSAFLHFFFPMLTAMVGYWATLSLNIPDFTRYAKSQDSQIFGQAFGLPVAMTLYSFAEGSRARRRSDGGLRRVRYLESRLLCWEDFISRWIAFLALISMLVATLNVNIGANVVSPSNDFSNLAPKYTSFRTGGLITGVPRADDDALEADGVRPGTSFLAWLVAYSGFLGPVAGIMVCGLFFIAADGIWK